MMPMDNGPVMPSTVSQPPAFFVVNRQSEYTGSTFDTHFSPAAWEVSSARERGEDLVFRNAGTCPDCGSGMVRSGVCYSCPGCGYGQCG